MDAHGYQQMIEFLRAQHDLLLCGHEDADADCLGSILALYQCFDGAGKNWRMVVEGRVQENLHYLPGLEQMLAPAQLDIEPQAVLLVDCGDVARAGSWLPPLAQGLPLYCIDHHLSNAFTGNLAVVETQAAAAAEIVTAICEQAGVVPGAAAALNLFSGIAADTGCFRYLNTTPRCHRQAAWLQELGVDLETVRIHLFEDRGCRNIKLLGLCCANMQSECGGLLAYSYLDRRSMERLGAGSADTFDLVNYTLVLSGVKVGILFEEYADHVKVSLRCRSGYRVDRLAAAWGGGGHALASGLKASGSLQQVMPRLLADARQIFAQE
ncbi:MAG: DHH family phosphoesterase [Bacillota bacterium]|nr:DHH family phosphoesterase [Bacillota bacterium]